MILQVSGKYFPETSRFRLDFSLKHENMEALHCAYLNVAFMSYKNSSGFSFLVSKLSNLSIIVQFMYKMSTRRVVCVCVCLARSAYIKETTTNLLCVLYVKDVCLFIYEQGSQ